MKPWLMILVSFFLSVSIALAQDTAAEGEDKPPFGEEADTESRYTLVPPDEMDATRAFQREDFTVKTFDDEKWEAIVQGVNFIQDAPEEERSISGVSLDLPYLKVVFYVIMFGIVLVILYFIVKNMSFDKKRRAAPVAYDGHGQAVDDIANLDTQALLDRAIADGNMRLAVRLYYLDLLKKLNAQGVIIWKKDKTNRDYLAELFARKFLFEEVRSLTISYESVWYGDHAVGVDFFKALSHDFETVRRQLDKEQ